MGSKTYTWYKHTSKKHISTLIEVLGYSSTLIVSLYTLLYKVTSYFLLGFLLIYFPSNIIESTILIKDDGIFLWHARTISIIILLLFLWFVPLLVKFLITSFGILSNKVLLYVHFNIPIYVTFIFFSPYNIMDQIKI